MGNQESSAQAEANILVGQSLETHGYRIVESDLFPEELHPMIDYILYDPSEHENRLMSEFIFEQIFSQLSTSSSQIQMPLTVFNLIDQEKKQIELSFQLDQIPLLQYMKSMIAKLQAAQQNREQEEMNLIRTQIQEQIQAVDVKRDLLKAKVYYANYQLAHTTILRISNVQDEGPAARAGLVSDDDYILGAFDSQAAIAHAMKVAHLKNEEFKPDDEVNEMFIISFASSSEFANFVSTYEEFEIRVHLFVYSSELEKVRQVHIRPERSWGGRGLLGCDVLQGPLHTPPRRNLNTEASGPLVPLSESSSSQKQKKKKGAVNIEEISQDDCLDEEPLEEESLDKGVQENDSVESLPSLDEPLPTMKAQKHKSYGSTTKLDDDLVDEETLKQESEQLEAPTPGEFPILPAAAEAPLANDKPLQAKELSAEAEPNPVTSSSSVPEQEQKPQAEPDTEESSSAQLPLSSAELPGEATQKDSSPRTNPAAEPAPGTSQPSSNARLPIRHNSSQRDLVEEEPEANQAEEDLFLQSLCGVNKEKVFHFMPILNFDEL